MIDATKTLRVIQYLGSKAAIIPYIEKEVRELSQTGSTILDIFAGTGIVGNALKDSFRIISNDIQEYSYLLNKVLLQVSQEDIAKYNVDMLYNSTAYKNNFQALSEIFGEPLAYEDDVISKKDLIRLSGLQETQIFYDGSNINYANDNIRYFNSCLGEFSIQKIRQYQLNSKLFPYSLFTLYYSNGYFGLRQCIEIDSLRFAIDKLSNKEYEDEPIKQVFLTCLLHAISEVVSSVGKHFAQPIKTVNRDNQFKEFITKRCLRDRQRSIRTKLEDMLIELKKNLRNPYHENIVYNLNYRDLLHQIKHKYTVDLVYVDPPYTIDHYSRFYHIPETLVKYDYPTLEYRKIKGKCVLMNGRYRADRFQSGFCVPSKAEEEFNELIKAIHGMGATMVLSYSMHDTNKGTRQRAISKETLEAIIKNYYSSVRLNRVNHNYRKLREKTCCIENLQCSELLYICQ